MSIKIAPSMMCVDLMNVERDLRELEAVGVDYLHIDIMDRHFVPNMMLPPLFVQSLRKLTDLPMDIHLMVEHPEVYLEDLAGGSSEDMISVHYESTVHVQRVLAAIRDLDKKAAVAICPSTPIMVLEDLLPSLDMILLMTVNPGYAGQKLVPGMLEKIVRLKEFLRQRGYDHIPVEVDGNVSFKHAPTMVEAGADILVVGTSSIFSTEGNVAENLQRLRKSYANIERNKYI